MRGKRKSDGAANTGRGDTVGLGWRGGPPPPPPPPCASSLPGLLLRAFVYVRDGRPEWKRPSAERGPHASAPFTLADICTDLSLFFPSLPPTSRRFSFFFLPPPTHLVVHSLCKVPRLFPAISSAIQMISHLTGSPPFSCILAPPLSLYSCYCRCYWLSIGH